MQVVLYTDDMEPITVINLPFSEAAMDEVFSKTNHIILPAPSALAGQYQSHDRAPIEAAKVRTVRVWWERFERKGRSTWHFFTKDEELAMLLKPAYLPGQRADVLEREQQAYLSGIIHAVEKLANN